MQHTCLIDTLTGSNWQVEFPHIDRDGFFPLSGTEKAVTNPASCASSTSLHLADNSGNLILNAQEFGFRRWQRKGITFTGNADHGSIGQTYAANDYMEFMIQCIDNINGISSGVDQIVRVGNK